MDNKDKGALIRYAVYVVPLLMCFFFCKNIYQSRTHHLDAWMGGGMRMFSSIDKMMFRISGFEIKHEGKTYFVNLRNVPELEGSDVKLRVMPSDQNLADVRKKIEEVSWMFDPTTQSVVPAKKDAVSIAKENIGAIVVSRIAFNQENKQVNFETIRKWQ